MRKNFNLNKDIYWMRKIDPMPCTWQGNSFGSTLWCSSLTSWQMECPRNDWTTHLFLMRHCYRDSPWGRSFGDTAPGMGKGSTNRGTIPPIIRNHCQAYLWVVFSPSQRYLVKRDMVTFMTHCVAPKHFQSSLGISSPWLLISGVPSITTLHISQFLL